MSVLDIMSRMNTKSRVVFHSAWVLLSTLFDNVTFFLVNIFIARYLSIDQYGEYCTALGFATFFSILTDPGINAAMMRMMAKSPGSDSTHFGNTLFIKNILSAASYLLMALALVFTNYSTNTILLALIMGLFRILNEYHMTFYALFDVNEKFILSSVIKSSFGICFFASTMIVIFLKGTYFDLSWARLFVVILFTLLLYVVSSRMIAPKKDRKRIREFLVCAAPFGLTALINNVFQRSNIIILSLIHGSTAAGIFTNGFLLFSALLFIPANITRVLLPHLYRRVHGKDTRSYQFAYDIYTKYLAVSGFFIMVMTILYAGDIIHLFFGARYNQSVPVLQISALAFPFTFSATSTIITSLDKQSAVARIQLIGLGVNLVSGIALIWKFGMNGAAASAVITYVFLTAANIWYVRKERIVTIGQSLFVYFSLAIISAGCISVKIFLMPSMNFILSGTIVASAFAILCVPFLLTRDDIRIMKEIIRMKKK